jgi:serine-type D-Ala-D-Ala carboxypeptidase (penicillin-binding protein 5/6)
MPRMETGRRRPRPVGSLTKLMTARVVLQRGHLHRTVVVPPLRLRPDESRAGLEPGERLSRLALLQALLVPSGNDAAEALAAAPGRRFFVAAMNRVAERLGLARTDYANPSGMPAPGQHSTARDSIRLSRLLMADERFRRIVRRRSVRIGGATLPRRNTLLGRSPGVDGVKTGTLDGNWSMVASATGAGGRVYAAVLGAPSREARDRDAHCLLSVGRRRLQHAAS